MEISYRILSLKKRFPLRISRGVKDGVDNLYVTAESGGHQGLGEMSPGASEGAETAEAAREQLEAYLPLAGELDDIRAAHARAMTAGVAPCAWAALDIALWDLRAKQAGLPLFRLLGLPRPVGKTSVTLGILPAEEVAERMAYLSEIPGVRHLKIKLGSPEGADADRQMYEAALAADPDERFSIRVDANGGWDLATARGMLRWLSERRCDYVEQPLKEGHEADLAGLFPDRPLPIFVDESCRFAHQIPDWADRVDGVNMKLMKCGGISGALDILSTARAHGLGTMIGCMGESSVSIAAGAAVSGALDHIDLDSQLNLAPDPASGLPLVDGVVSPREFPGHGAHLVSDQTLDGDAVI